MSSRHLLLTAGTLVAAAALALPAPATAGSAPGSTARGSTPPGSHTVSETYGMFTDLVLSGTCPDQPDLKNVVSSPLKANAFAPIHLLEAVDFTDTGKLLLPYEITVTEQGLKTRHAIPGPAPTNRVTCFLEGAIKKDGYDVTVTVTGTIRGVQSGCPRRAGRPVDTAPAT